MKIYSPLPACFLVQGYGLKGTAPSMMAAYQAMGLKSGHNGLDFGAMCKDNQVIHGGQCEPVYCSVAGVGDLIVDYKQTDDKGGFGLNLVDSNGNRYCYWHFDAIDPIIYVGATVKFGQRLGIAGNTGMSTGAHCHFGYYPAVGGDPNMGGASDPTPFFEDRFAGDIATYINVLQKLINAYLALVKLLKK